MSIKNAFTDKPMNYSNLMTRDEKSYKMLPSDAKVWFKEVSLDKSIKNEIKGPGRIIKQCIKWKDIEYYIEYPINSLKLVSSLASLIYLSKP